MRTEKLVHDSTPWLQFLGYKPADKNLGEPFGSQVPKVGSQIAAQFVAESAVAEHGRDRLAAGRLILQGILQEFCEIADLGAAAPQRRGKGVVLLLCAPDPGNGVEEELGAISRGYPPQFQTRTMKQDRAEPADLAVHAVGVAHGHPRIPHSAA